MKVLSFEPLPQQRGRRIGRARFDERSSLALSAACVVANAFRETLTHAFGTPVQVHLYEPVLPRGAAWAVIAADALLYRIRGTLADAVLVMRRIDAAALAAATFGEPAAADAALSTLERSVLDRLARALSRHLTPVCGAPVEPLPEPLNVLDGCTTYVEMEVRSPVLSRIGIALSREPEPARPALIDPSALDELEIELSARTKLPPITAAEALRLEPGAFMPIETTNGPPESELEINGVTLATGEIGVSGRRLALAVSRLVPQERFG